MSKLYLAAILALISTASALAQGKVKVETAAAPAGAAVPKPLLDVLEPQGARVVGDQGAICEVWLRKGLTLGPPAGGLGDIMYGQLGNGNLIGVLHFSSQGADFRGQAIKPGYYALRYALIPQDGAHMGVYATRDVLKLTPVVADTEIDQALSADEMTKLSRMASGTPHPAVLVMSAVSAGASFPSVAEDDMSHTNLQLKLQGKNGELPIGITVVGKWEGM
jgi:hypothetical protein